VAARSCLATDSISGGSGAAAAGALVEQRRSVSVISIFFPNAASLPGRSNLSTMCRIWSTTLLGAYTTIVRNWLSDLTRAPKTSSSRTSRSNESPVNVLTVMTSASNDCGGGACWADRSGGFVCSGASCGKASDPAASRVASDITRSLINVLSISDQPDHDVRIGGFDSNRYCLNRRLGARTPPHSHNGRPQRLTRWQERQSLFASLQSVNDCRNDGFSNCHAGFEQHCRKQRQRASHHPARHFPAACLAGAGGDFHAHARQRVRRDGFAVHLAKEVPDLLFVHACLSLNIPRNRTMAREIWLRTVASVDPRISATRGVSSPSISRSTIAARSFGGSVASASMRSRFCSSRSNSASAERRRDPTSPSSSEGWNRRLRSMHRLTVTR